MAVGESDIFCDVSRFILFILEMNLPDLNSYSSSTDLMKIDSGLYICKKRQHKNRLSWKNTFVVRLKLEYLSTEGMNEMLFRLLVVRLTLSEYGLKVKQNKIWNQQALSYWTTVRLELLSGFGLFSCLST